jgi:hypothetical protein
MAYEERGNESEGEGGKYTGAVAGAVVIAAGANNDDKGDCSTVPGVKEVGMADVDVIVSGSETEVNVGCCLI